MSYLCAPQRCIYLHTHKSTDSRSARILLPIPNAHLLSQAGSHCTCAQSVHWQPSCVHQSPGDRWPPAPARTCGVGRGSHKCTMLESEAGAGCRAQRLDATRVTSGMRVAVACWCCVALVDREWQPLRAAGAHAPVAYPGGEGGEASPPPKPRKICKG